MKTFKPGALQIWLEHQTGDVKKFQAWVDKTIADRSGQL